MLRGSSRRSEPPLLPPMAECGGGLGWASCQRRGGRGAQCAVAVAAVHGQRSARRVPSAAERAHESSRRSWGAESERDGRGSRDCFRCYSAPLDSWGVGSWEDEAPPNGWGGEVLSVAASSSTATDERAVKGDGPEKGHEWWVRRGGGVVDSADGGSSGAYASGLRGSAGRTGRAGGAGIPRRRC